MKPVLYIPAAVFLLLVASAVTALEKRTDLGNVTGGTVENAQEILDKKCTECHLKDRIDSAISKGRNMSLIQNEMEKKGARLNAREREVLGIFWQQSRPISKGK